MIQPILFLLVAISSISEEAPEIKAPTRETVLNVLDVCAVNDRGFTILVARETFHSRWLPCIVFDVVSTAEDGTFRVQTMQVRRKEKTDTLIPFRERHPYGLSCLSCTMEVLTSFLWFQN
jgi:hypothetical protein